MTMLDGIIRSYLGDTITAAGIRLVTPSGAVIGRNAARLTLKFHRWRDMLRVAVSPSIGLAEAYANHNITIEGGKIYDLLYRLLDQKTSASNPWFMNATRRIGDMVQPVFEGWTQALARRNVSHHYDLGNDLYKLFLDADAQYSCAYFDRPGVDINRAQLRKKQHIARKLKLDRRKSVLDIGCGWGGMALHLSEQAKSVKGITLSTQQIAGARKRARGNKRITFALQDYRNETRRYDRIVSVGMLEHVGQHHYGTFFGAVSRCLADDGLALIHTIGRSGVPGGTDSFIRKYIFPGSYVPSLSQLSTEIEKTDLAISDVETLFLHYAETLKAWRMRFMANRKQAVELKSEHFARIWEFYLASCEAAFRQGILVVFQIQLLKPATTRPVTREYIYR